MLHVYTVITTYNKTITIFQHDISYFSIAFKKSFNIFFSCMMRQSPKIYSGSHFELSLKKNKIQIKIFMFHFLMRNFQSIFLDLKWHIFMKNDETFQSASLATSLMHLSSKILFGLPLFPNVCLYTKHFFPLSYEYMQVKIKPGAPQGAALYDRRGRTLNSWGKYGQNIQV